MKLKRTRKSLAAVFMLLSILALNLSTSTSITPIAQCAVGDCGLGGNADADCQAKALADYNSCRILGGEFQPCWDHSVGIYQGCMRAWGCDVPRWPSDN